MVSKFLSPKESTNFLQVGQTIECGGCHPEKFEDCVAVFARFIAKCECICHNRPLCPDKNCPFPEVAKKHNLKK